MKTYEYDIAMMNEIKIVFSNDATFYELVKNVFDKYKVTKKDPILYIAIAHELYEYCYYKYCFIESEYLLSPEYFKVISNVIYDIHCDWIEDQNKN